ncbi:glycosyltransferase family 4 protein [Acinetobacter johnsonii]|uniref:glycosyltransferase family 4 protein n=1 Tax=Acinetobacter johnsonii TaxID=40214 RepID=UPI0021E2062C|nr:glycosyltransferase family 4 protein [Acinetobacter johnsonii]MCV2450810.1 glycosyltransferase family 4 protein [Acinetobacter johnsonii]
MKNILFITWDGPETQYLERLFLPIFSGLEKKGYKFHVLQFGWGTPEKFVQRAQACAKLNIPYKSVKVFRWFRAIGSFLTAFLGQYAIQKAVAAWNIDTLMPRSLMPALAVLSMPKSTRQRLNIVFDADGLAADERVDFAGISSTGKVYRLLRDIEMQMLCHADGVITRTEASRKVLIARAGAALPSERCYRVSNGVEVKPFVEAFNSHVQDEKSDFTLCYCGSIGPQYRLPEMLDIAVKLKQAIPQLRFKLFSPALQEIQKQLEVKDLIGQDWIEYQMLPAVDVPNALAACDLALALREPKFSTQGVLPIKLGEYLLAGLPILGTPNVGNAPELSETGVFHSAELDQLNKSIDWIVNSYIPQQKEWKKRSHEAGLHFFSLKETIERYSSALRDIEKALMTHTE